MTYPLSEHTEGIQPLYSQTYIRRPMRGTSIRIIRGRSRTWEGAIRIALYRHLNGWGKQRVEKHNGSWIVGR